MASPSGKEYSVGALCDFSFYVGDGDGKGVMGPRTTNINSQKFDCWNDGGNFVCSQSREYSSMSHSYK